MLLLLLLLLCCCNRCIFSNWFADGGVRDNRSAALERLGKFVGVATIGGVLIPTGLTGLVSGMYDSVGTRCMRGKCGMMLRLVAVVVTVGVMMFFIIDLSLRDVATFVMSWWLVSGNLTGEGVVEVEVVDWLGDGTMEYPAHCGERERNECK